MFLAYSLTAQYDSLKQNNFDHLVHLDQYTFTFSANGGTELTYSLRYHSKKRIVYNLRAGLFIQANYGNNHRFSKPLFYASNSYVPLFLGAGISFGQKRRLIAGLELGLPIFWLSEYSPLMDSQLFSKYWVYSSNFSSNAGAFRQRIVLIPQIQLSYTMKCGIGLQGGVSGYLTQYVTDKFVNKQTKSFVVFNPALKLGLSYRF